MAPPKVFDNGSIPAELKWTFLTRYCKWIILSMVSCLLTLSLPRSHKWFSPLSNTILMRFKFKNLLLDQSIFPWLIFVFILITFCLILYGDCKEKFCLSHSKELKGHKYVTLWLVWYYGCLTFLSMQIQNVQTWKWNSMTKFCIP